MSNFPASEGWLRMTLTLKVETPLAEEELKMLASWGKPERYEWGRVTQSRKTVKVIFRQKDWKPQPEAFTR